jgi:hypothetical protein
MKSVFAGHCMRSSTLSSQRTTAYTSRSRRANFMFSHCSTRETLRQLRARITWATFVSELAPIPRLSISDFGQSVLASLEAVADWPCSTIVGRANAVQCDRLGMWPVASCSQLAMQHNYAGACAPATSHAIQKLAKHAKHSPSRFQSRSPHRSEAASGANVCTFISVLATWCGVLACVHVSAAHPHRPPQIMLPAGRDRDTRTFRSECMQVRRTPPDTH